MNELKKKNVSKTSLLITNEYILEHLCISQIYFSSGKKKNPILNVQYCVDSNNTTTLEMEK